MTDGGSETETPSAVVGDGYRPTSRAGALGTDDPGRVRDVLDTLNEKVTLLIDRHARLAERYAVAVTERREANERAARLTTGKLDPRVLEDQLRQLEDSNGRLERHAAYLEGRIEDLLARVRYAVER